MNTPDVLVLAPGFLGFARFGGFYYFADRLIAVLRGLLEEPLGYPVPVVPVTTLPTNSLRDRQEALLQNLATLMDAINRARPAGLKANYIETVYLTSTQGPSVKLDLGEAVALAGRATG